MTAEHDTDTPEPRLNSTEIRILGCLIEKQATNPETYPLTLNAVVLACNQKTSREPVMNLSQGQVGQSLRVHDFEDADQVVHQLERLIARGLAVLVPRQAGQREDRYTHALGDQADIEAIIAARGSPVERGAGGVSVERIEELEARIAALEERLAQLEQA